MSEVLIHARGQAPRFMPNPWLGVDSVDAIQAAQDGTSPILIPLSVWLSWREQGQGSEAAAQSGAWPASRLGLLLKPDDDVTALKAHQVNGQWPWSLIAVHFPVFRDGRGFSQAHLLRQRLGWGGELRAVGDVLIDQLRQMARVGFDAFALREDQNHELALQQFHAFTVQLQNDWRAERSVITNGKEARHTDQGEHA
ncbi:MAG: hypothetical protein RL307_640 [Pseudomonadota bacterium]